MSEQIEQRALTIHEQAAALAIIDQRSADRAGELKIAISDLRREAKTHHQPMIDAAHRAHRAALDALKRIDEPLAEAEQRINTALAEWISAEMRRIAEEERARREEAERILREEAEREAAHLTALYGEEVSADDVIELAAAAAVATAPKVVVAGVSGRHTYSARVIDLRKLVAYVAEHPEMLGLLSPNQPALNAMARANKGALAIPGIAIEKQLSVARRAR